MTNLFDPSILAAASAAPTTPVVVPTVPAGLGDDAWFAASSALAADGVTVPGMVRPFLPWQASAYTFANDSIARWGGVLLGDDMGLGKTQVMLALAADYIRTTGKPAIIVIPPVAEAGYFGDARAAFPHLTVTMVKGHKRTALDRADIYLLSDDSRTMRTWLTDVSEHNGKQVFTASAWVQDAGIIIRDEIHRDKGNGGKPTGRAKVMLSVGAYARSVGMPVVGATGTLLTNKPVEGYLPLQVIGGEHLLTTITPGAHKASGYLWRYCAPQQIRAKGGRIITTFGGLDLSEAHHLHEYLRRTVYVRREKSDLGEGVLPHAGWKVSPLALPNGTMRRYQRVEKDFYNLCAEERGRVWADKVSRAQAIVQMNMLHEEAGVAKAEAAADYIADLVEEGEQVVAFYIHKRVWEKLALALLNKGIDVVSINGSVTGQDRIDAIEDFQNSDAQVCLAQIKSAGMAVTLTAACHAVFVQCPWSAGDLKQAADRIFRVDDITRQRAADGGKVTWHVLQAHYADSEPTFDALIFQVLEMKAKVCDAVNAGRPVTMDTDSVMYEALMAWQPSAKRHGGW